MEGLVEKKLFEKAKEIDQIDPIYLDLTDISKPKSKEMECLGTTWDGSRGEANKGYEIVNLYRSDGVQQECLYNHLYSTEEKTYESEQREINKVLNIWEKACQGYWKGLLVIDRGGDSIQMYKSLLEREASFLIRMNTSRGVKNRNLFLEKEEITMKVDRMVELYGQEEDFLCYCPVHKKQVKTKYGHKKIQVKQLPKTTLTVLWIQRACDKQPLVWITDQEVKNKDDVIYYYMIYFNRGKEEAYFKLLKQKFQMEKIQLLKIKKVKQMVYLLTLVSMFVDKMMEKATNVLHQIYLSVKTFLQREQKTVNRWTLIDTISYLLNNTKIYTKSTSLHDPPNYQLQFLFPNLSKW